MIYIRDHTLQLIVRQHNEALRARRRRRLAWVFAAMLAFIAMVVAASIALGG